MGAILRGAGAIVSHGGKTFNFGPGALPDSTPPEVVEVLRRRGALRSHAPDAESEPEPEAAEEPDPEEPTPDPDPAALSVEALAAKIESEGLNAPETVALAGEDPARAQAVIDAEQLSHGGDGRATVLKPLAKLAGSA